MSKRGRPRKPGPRYPNDELKEERVAPTHELLLQRVAILAGTPAHKVHELAKGDMESMMGVARLQLSADFPVEIMFARRPCQLLLYPEESKTAAELRRETAARFANLAWHVFGQPFAGCDARHRRLVPPVDTADDADHRRARQGDERTPEERAEDVRARYEAILSLLGRNRDLHYALRSVVVECRPIESLTPDVRKRKRIRRQLLEALDKIESAPDIRKAEDEVRADWARRAA